MKFNEKELYHKAYLMRKDIIRMLAAAGSGHPGGSLSLADIMSTLFFYKMNYSLKNMFAPDRDKIILSKGHAAPALYAAFRQIGYLQDSDLLTLRKLGSPLQGHPDKHLLPAVEISTGSLGQGFSASVGIALASKLNGYKNNVYVILGDGEMQEGQVWEAGMFAAAKGIDNLVAILDCNRLQIDGCTEDVNCIDPIADKWKAFGWEVLEIDGHNISEIVTALDKADEILGRPVMIIAHTTKGKGVSFMENKVHYHGVAPNKDEEQKALMELEEVIKKYG